MILLAYTVYDSKANAYLPPFYAVNHAVATRTFTTACSEPGHAFYLNAEDFTLFHVGSWDPEGGLLVPDVGTPIAKAHEQKALMAERASAEAMLHG